VWRTDRSTALKVLADRRKFEREAAVYARLREHGVTEVRGYRVPQLERADPELLALELTIVRPPFVLDFASACLDSAAPEFPPEVMAEWVVEKREEFGANWPQALAVLAGLRHLGIYMTDVHPGNIQFSPDSSG
jgi:hypothetical protein